MDDFRNISRILLLSLFYCGARGQSVHKNVEVSQGAIIRGDQTKKNIALVFTGDEFGDGGESIAHSLQQQNIRASFFLTGNFYRNPQFKSTLQELQQQGNYLGSHSDKHLLYCDWTQRDRLLVTRRQFDQDIRHAFAEMKQWNISKQKAKFFLPPYEWYNDSIARWARETGLQLVCFTPGTRSNADYTYPEMNGRYLSSDSILQSILTFEKASPNGLNGFILLLHIGTDPRRTDKMYARLPVLISELKSRGYRFVTINELFQ
jgi:peptidoglycan/xylan/chitin deacetylase (PgdA/CDA1 family)